MQHLTEGEIHAYQDHELDAPGSEQVRLHLESCTLCQEKAATTLARTQRVQSRMDSLTASPKAAPLSLPAARTRFRARLNETTKEHESMFSKVFGRISRPVWVGLAVILVLAAALAFPPVQALANSFLSLFRVQQVAVVPINPANLPQEMTESSKLESLIANDIQMEQNGETQEASDAADASQKAGFAVRLPAQANTSPKLRVNPGGNVSFNINLETIQIVLDEIGRSDIELPKELNGETVNVAMQSSVIAQYGTCQYDLEKAREEGKDPDAIEDYSPRQCTSLAQMPSPIVTAPEGLNVAQVGEAFLQVLGMSREEAQAFSKNIDWATTLVIPIPTDAASYEEVTVDGVKGTLIRRYDGIESPYTLMWVKNGTVYVLNGWGAEDGLSLANSLQ